MPWHVLVAYIVHYNHSHVVKLRPKRNVSSSLKTASSTGFSVEICSIVLCEACGWGGAENAGVENAGAITDGKP